ncbi:hypothetical protein K456DRAFT_40285 [Colletotrichum gloeosporioides 23]|nr:hypothetical protein K456DRAFT_40285 [Colletotrichum gloeosporioides 23]
MANHGSQPPHDTIFVAADLKCVLRKQSLRPWTTSPKSITLVVTQHASGHVDTVSTLEDAGYHAIDWNVCRQMPSLLEVQTGTCVVLSPSTILDPDFLDFVRSWLVNAIIVENSELSYPTFGCHYGQSEYGQFGLIAALEIYLDRRCRLTRVLITRLLPPSAVVEFCRQYDVKADSDCIRLPTNNWKTVYSAVESQSDFLMRQCLSTALNHFHAAIDAAAKSSATKEAQGRQLAVVLTASNSQAIALADEYGCHYFDSADPLEERRRRLHAWRTSQKQTIFASSQQMTALDLQDVSLVINYDNPKCAIPLTLQIEPDGPARITSIHLSDSVGGMETSHPALFNFFRGSCRRKDLTKYLIGIEVPTCLEQYGPALCDLCMQKHCQTFNLTVRNNLPPENTEKGGSSITEYQTLQASASAPSLTPQSCRKRARPDSGTDGNQTHSTLNSVTRRDALDVFNHACFLFNPEKARPRCLYCYTSSRTDPNIPLSSDEHPKKGCPLAKGSESVNRLSDLMKKKVRLSATSGLLYMLGSDRAAFLLT